MSEKELYKQLEEYDKEVIRLSKENKKLQQEIQELYDMAKEQDSDNVNLIDRLENILKTLKGE